MIKAFGVIFSIPDLRNKIFFTLSLLLVFRIGAHITVPGVNYEVLAGYLGASASNAGKGLTDYIDLFAGGAFKRGSVFALGIMPYISASIIMQLMMVLIPSLQKLQKEGEFGRKKINQYTRYGTVILCSLQAYGITVWLKSMHDRIAMSGGLVELIEGGSGLGFISLAILAITTGTLILMWMGELITEKGIGNGISLLIFCGIIAGAPEALAKFWGDVKTEEIDVILALILLVIFVVMIGLSIVLTEGQRKIPLQYGKRIVGRRMMQGSSQTLPIKVNAANVMPIIFASSLLLFPSQIASWLGESYPDFASSITSLMTPGTLVYSIVFVILIIFFAYFYTSIQYNPKDLAEALKKNGGYVPGIRPGQQTEDFLEKLLNRIVLSGALFLAFIAIAPDLIIGIWDLQKYTNLAYLFGGTSLLIIVGVALDTLKQIESQLVMRHYDGFMDKSKKTSAHRGRIVRG